MEKLRRDVHSVFARRQSGLGSTAGASDRLLRQALAPAAARHRLAPQLAAALATLLVGAAVAYVVVVTRGHLKSQNPVTQVTPPVRASASATAVPAPTPLARPLAISPATPAILYFDPVDAHQVDGVTWDGSKRGVVGTTSGLMSLAQNPAGTLYVTHPDIRDRSGQVVAQVAGAAKISTVWADDGQHYCQLVSPSDLPPVGGEPATLRIVTSGGSVRNVTQVGRMYEQSGAAVAACSLERNRAVVTQLTSMGVTTQVWVVDLTTGRVIWTRSFPDGPFGSISRDGQYVAVPVANGTTLETTVYGPTGLVVGHVNGAIRGFSWDGSVAVVAQYLTPLTVVRWRDDKLIWTAPAAVSFAASLPEPGGSRIAILTNSDHPQPGGGYYPTVDVYTVGPGGTAVRILTNVTP